MLTAGMTMSGVIRTGLLILCSGCFRNLVQTRDVVPRTCSLSYLFGKT